MKAFRFEKFDKLVAILRETGEQMRAAKLPLVASSLAYTTLLSIIPLFAVSFAVFHLVGGLERTFNAFIPVILKNLTIGTGEEVVTTLRKFISNADAKSIGAGGVIGLFITSLLMISSVDDAIHHVWQNPTKRSFIHRISAYWILITLGPIALAIVVGLVSAYRLPFSNLAPSGTGMFIGMTLLFTGMYKWVPNCRVKWRYAFISAVSVSVLWNLTRLGYSLYLQRVVTYHKIYGSLGAIPILLLWIFLAWLAILSGAALTAVLQKRSPRAGSC